ncbi:MAG: TlpA family protein disulfide reductase [Phycisphaerae bacterium]
MESAPISDRSAVGQPTPMPSLDGAPDFFRAAFEQARKANRPVIVDFWASWCAPCLRLKRETFHAPEVASALEFTTLIYVDLDEHLELGTKWGVHSVPNVFFIDRQGRIVDRLYRFEAPAAFLARLKKLLGDSRRTSQ